MLQLNGMTGMCRDVGNLYPFKDLSDYDAGSTIIVTFAGSLRFWCSVDCRSQFRIATPVAVEAENSDSFTTVF